MRVYRVGQKSKPAYFCNNFVYCQPIFILLAHIHYRKFITRGYIVSPPNMVCVTTLPCKIVTMTFFTLNFIHCCKTVNPVFTSVVLIANFCWMIFKRIVLDKCYLFSSDGTPLWPGDYFYGSRRRRLTNVNFGFKQFVRAVGIYAAQILYDHEQHFNNVP